MADTLFAGRCVDGGPCPVRGGAFEPVLLKWSSWACRFPATATASTSVQDRPRPAPPRHQRGTLHQQADDRMSGGCRAGQGRADAGQDPGYQNPDKRRHGLRLLCLNVTAQNDADRFVLIRCKNVIWAPAARLVCTPTASIPSASMGPRGLRWSGCQRQKPDRMAVRACLRCAALECFRHLYAGAAAGLLRSGGRQR